MLTGKIRTVCPICGPIQVRAADVEVCSHVDTMQNIYRFRCPNCSTWTVNDARPEVVTLLLNAGARVEQSLAPRARDRRDLGPISDGELIEFHRQLDRLPTAAEGT